MTAIVRSKTQAIRDHVRRIRSTPDDSRDAFTKLERAGQLPAALSVPLPGMVGFRNIAAHRYHELDLVIVRSILDRHLDDLLAFADLASTLSDS